MRRPLRVAATAQLARSACESGFDVVQVPESPARDFHRGWEERVKDGPRMFTATGWFLRS